jgi:leucine-rich repeat protein SHOC2
MTAGKEATDLDLKWLGLTSLPPEIGQLTKLTLLRFDNNRLRELPGSLRQLWQLHALFLHGNPKLQLPTSVLGLSIDEWIEAGYQLESAPKAGPILDY